jgi:hypothetical protein
MRRPLVSGIVGLTVTAILAVGLVAVVVSRQTHSGSAVWWSWPRKGSVRSRSTLANS